MGKAHPRDIKAVVAQQARDLLDPVLAVLAGHGRVASPDGVDGGRRRLPRIVQYVRPR